ncbi:rhodanese homologue 2 [Striga asiatica]|uniref:Rhodanese homologue 2 n=1 Tax=Striga asiatica TaxID=4170 RepID=A0A5A7NY19_STRAF|nr:rhodanese homologue 2 [Striga asiatica]
MKGSRSSVTLLPDGRSLRLPPSSSRVSSSSNRGGGSPDPSIWIRRLAISRRRREYWAKLLRWMICSSARSRSAFSGKSFQFPRRCDNRRDLGDSPEAWRSLVSGQRPSTKCLWLRQGGRAT